MKKTFVPTPKDIKTTWHFLDATDIVLGNLAADIASILIGKRNPKFTPNTYLGDKVVVTNVEKIVVTGRKLTDKMYYRHTGFPGGIKSATYTEMMNKDATKVLRIAVKNMLPKNRLQKVRLASLYIYEGAEHPHIAHVQKVENNG